MEPVSLSHRPVDCPNSNFPACGGELSWDGQYWIRNNGRYYSDCLPNGHMGFCVSKVKRYTDPLRTVREWMLESDQGATSVNWAPQTVNGLNLWGSSDFGDWNSTNADGWVTGQNWKAPKGAEQAIGGCVVDWANNKWYRSTPGGQPAWWAGLHVDNGVGIAPPKRAAMPAQGALGKRTALTLWTDLPGRSLTARAPAGRVVRVAPGTNPRLMVRER